MNENHLKGVSWEVSLAGVELAPREGVYDLADVGDRSVPVEALAEVRNALPTRVRGAA
jgi:hypothetical protein